VSRDAIHFREPVPDFKIVPSLEEPDRAEPRLTQGQGFENIGDRTLFWYGIWTEVNRDGPTGVRVATWPRDRLGHFAPSPGIRDAHCISRVISPTRRGARVYLNADGLSADAQLAVEILDERFRAIPGYGARDCLPITAGSGFRLPVAWRGHDSLERVDPTFRVRVNWTGRDSEKSRLFAVYVE